MLIYGGCSILWRAFRSLGLQILLMERGFVYARGKRVEGVRFADVAEVNEYHYGRDHAIGLFEASRGFTLSMNDGSSYHLPRSLNEVRRLGRFIQMKTRNPDLSFPET